MYFPIAATSRNARSLPECQRTSSPTNAATAVPTASIGFEPEEIFLP